MGPLPDIAAADAVWAAQLGPALTEADVARLLGRDTDDVARAPGLLRLRQRETADRVYPLFQFTANGQLSGVAAVVTVLSPVLGPLSIASWLPAGTASSTACVRSTFCAPAASSTCSPWPGRSPRMRRGDYG